MLRPPQPGDPRPRRPVAAAGPRGIVQGGRDQVVARRNRGALRPRIRRWCRTDAPNRVLDASVSSDEWHLDFAKAF